MKDTFSLRQVRHTVGYRENEILAMIAQGEFPAAVEPGRWRKDDVYGWRTKEMRRAVPRRRPGVRMLDVRNMANLLDVSRPYVYKLIENGQIPLPTKVGRKFWWSWWEVMKWLGTVPNVIAGGWVCTRDLPKRCPQHPNKY